jgi:tRNA(adenine34) deaminase
MVIVMNEKIQKKMIQLLKKAKKKNEVPVAAIIIYKNKIIASSYNKREKNNNVLGHAEIICIKKAAKKLKTWKLDECKLYVSLEPCSMCKCIINEARISNVFYLIKKLENKKEYNHTNYKKIDEINLENKIKLIMKNFFKSKR